MVKVIALVRRNFLPQLNLGSVSWLLHRVTGVALVVYLVPHFVTIHSARDGREALNAVLGWYAGPLIAATEWVLVLGVAFHLFNGLRIIAVDFFDLSHTQRALFWCVMAACAAVLLGASFVFLPKMLAPAG
jgi:succinate dehydrogenase / fumarate reductase cytochrome b subunit